jgi:YggT family protein
MILFANFLNAVASILHMVLMIYLWILVVRAVLSWVHVPSMYQVKLILYHLTEPVLAPLRRLVPPYKFGGLDITPILAFILILFIDSFLVKSLSLYAQQILRQHGAYTL